MDYDVSFSPYLSISEERFNFGCSWTTQFLLLVVVLFYLCLKSFFFRSWKISSCPTHLRFICGYWAVSLSHLKIPDVYMVACVQLLIERKQKLPKSRWSQNFCF
ncbi:hypothetical protein SAY87_028703 [Trapa incisa]|uniref:Uncharacterized protein n=1 Tax=Trapa incisa TaxID=236973 RepID=A0AAN7KYA7_9MYRT|nr:hypothetical protein SAY87_028703 [Trapa incisa]